MIRLLVFLISILNSLLVFSQHPQWIDEQYRSRKFPPEQFLQGFSCSIKSAGESTESLLNRLGGYSKNQLLESIKVKIKSSSNLKTIDYGSVNNQEFKQEIDTYSEADLFGLKYETFFNTNNSVGYAFSYVNKEELIQFHINMIKIQFETIIQKQTLINTSDMQYLKQTISLLFECLNSIEQIKKSQELIISLNSKFEGVNLNRTIMMEQTLCQNLNDLFKKITIFPFDIEIAPSLNNKWEYQTSVQITYNKKASSSLPIIFFLFNGKRKLSSTFTDDSGIATIFLNTIPFSQKDRKIISELDLLPIINNDSLTFAKYINDIQIPTCTYNLNLKNIPIWIESNTNSDGNIESKLKESLIKLGFELTNDKNKAIYIFKINYSAREGKYINGIQFMYVNVELQIIDVKNGNCVYQNKILDCKGGGTETTQALNKALVTAANKISNDLHSFFTN